MSLALHVHRDCREHELTKVELTEGFSANAKVK